MRASLLALYICCSAVAGWAASEAPYRFVLGQAYTQEGAYREANESFSRAIELEPNDPFIRIEFAELLLRVGRLDEAAEQAAAARKLAPDNVDVLRLYAHVERTRAEASPEALTRAREAYLRLHKARPADAEAAVSLAQIDLIQGRFESAIEVLEATLAQNPRQRLVVSLLMQALERSGQNELAEQRMFEFLESEPTYLRGRLILAERLQKSGEHRAAADLLMAAPAEDREVLDLRRSLAVELFRSGDLEAALLETDAWIAAEPTALGGRYLRASILVGMGEDENAEEELRQILGNHPTYLQAASLLADVLVRKGEPEEAALLLRGQAELLAGEGLVAESEQLLLQLVDLRVRSAEWQEVLDLTELLLRRPGHEMSSELSLLAAQALVELDRRQEALKRLEELRGDAGVAGRAAASRAELLFELGRREEAVKSLRELGRSTELDDLVVAAQSFHRLELYSEAIPVLRHADALSPGKVQVMFWLGAAYEREGQHAEAEQEFRRLLGIEPEFAPALNYLGYMWAERGVHLAEAVDLVERAVELEPDNGAYIDSLGWAYFQLGRFEEARGHLERAVTLVGDDSVVFEHLGDVYKAVGEVDRAQEQYRRALELGGANAEAVRRKLRKLRDSI